MYSKYNQIVILNVVEELIQEGRKGKKGRDYEGGSFDDCNNGWRGFAWRGWGPRQGQKNLRFVEILIDILTNNVQKLVYRKYIQF